MTIAEFRAVIHPERGHVVARERPIASDEQPMHRVREDGRSLASTDVQGDPDSRRPPIVCENAQADPGQLVCVACDRLRTLLHDRAAGQHAGSADGQVQMHRRHLDSHRCAPVDTARNALRSETDPSHGQQRRAPTRRGPADPVELVTSRPGAGEVPSRALGHRIAQVNDDERPRRAVSVDSAARPADTVTGRCTRTRRPRG